MKNKKIYQSTMTFALCLCINLTFAQLSSYFAGNNAGGSNSGTFCTGVGSGSITNGNSGTNNSGFGSSSLGLNTLGAGNTGIGSYSLYHNNSGDENTATGNRSLYFNTTGSNNTSQGSYALYSNEIGSYNVAVGYSALYYSVSGNNSTAIGYQALYRNINGNNTAVGFHALFNNEIGSDNTAVGNNSMLNMTSGLMNTSLGADALNQVTSGNGNTALGRKAGYSRVKYTNCTFLGAEADATATSFSNSTAIGYKAKVDGSNKVRVGNTSITSIGGQVGWTTLSDLRLKENINDSKLGLDFILNLHPVTYNYIDENQKGILYTGLIAQEVDDAAKKSGVEYSGVDKNGEYWGIRYGELTVPLIKAVQEINKKSDERNLQLEEKNKALENKVSMLENSIKQMQQCLNQLCSDNQKTNFENLQPQLFISPNPATDFVKVTISSSNQIEKFMVKIVDASGKTMQSFSSIGNADFEINTSTFNAGIYLVQLFQLDKLTQTSKLIIQ